MSTLNSSEINNPSFLQNETDLFELEKKCRAMVGQQCTLENQLKKLKFQIYEISFEKSELQRTLNRERRELFNTKAQLNLIQKAMQQWEQERFSTRDASVKQKLQLEALIEERNLLNDQMKNLEIENINKKLQLEETEKQLLRQQTFEKIVETKQSSVNSIVENIFGQIKELRKNQNFLEKNVSLAKHFGEQMIELLDLHHQALNNLYITHSKLKENEISWNNEVDSLREKNYNESVILKNADYENENNLKQCESMILSLEHRVNEEIEERTKLHESLQNALSKQIESSILEQELKNQILELEKKIELATGIQKNPIYFNGTTQT